MANSQARDLRLKQTDAEKHIWRRLRMKQLAGLRFRRQFPIDLYIVDFICLAKRLIIEIDGGQHGGEHDAVRDAWLESQGFRILRFWNNEVLENIEGVLAVIAGVTPPPDLLPQGEEE